MTINEIIVKKYEVVCDECGTLVSITSDRCAADRALRGHMRQACPKIDHRCSGCNATLDRCSDLIVKRGKGCCAQCFTTDTHDASSTLCVASLKAAQARKDMKERKSGG